MSQDLEGLQKCQLQNLLITYMTWFWQSPNFSQNNWWDTRDIQRMHLVYNLREFWALCQAGTKMCEWTPSSWFCSILHGLVITFWNDSRLLVKYGYDTMILRPKCIPCSGGTLHFGLTHKSEGNVTAMVFFGIRKTFWWLASFWRAKQLKQNATQICCAD